MTTTPIDGHNEHERVPAPASESVPVQLDIAIVGAGIGGLVAGYTLGKAGHKVTLYDSASELGEVGAGIQISPNVSRLLIRWGVGEEMKRLGVPLGSFALRRYSDGEEVGWNRIPYDPNGPYYAFHRADLQKILLDLARPYVTINLKSTVTNLDPSAPSITLNSGETISPHLVVGADGIHSYVRNVVVGDEDRPRPTGDEAYRALIPTSLMLEDPILKDLVNDQVCVWMGPKKHAVGYCIRNKELYNVVLPHPTTSTNEVVRRADNETMRQNFSEFEPRIRGLLALIEKTSVWSLMDREPLETWVHKDGKVCLLGDACHPMLPYRAQGAAMAIEDGAVLGNLLSRITHHDQLEYLLRAYQSIRHGRASSAQIESRMNQHIFHLPDGPQQRARDESMQKAREAALKEDREGPSTETNKGNENLWADKERTQRAFGYDLDAEMEEWWRKHEKEVLIAGSKL